MLVTMMQQSTCATTLSFVPEVKVEYSFLEPTAMTTELYQQWKTSITHGNI